MSEGFSPCLYNFTMPEDVGEGVPVTPPLWALLDHLIAVAYHMHVPCDEHLVPDVTQMQWVLGFICSQEVECNKYKHLNCLKNSLHTAIQSKMRSPPFADQPKVECTEINMILKKEGENEKQEETEPLCIPITLMDILSQQPKYLRLKTKNTPKDHNKISCSDLPLSKSVEYDTYFTKLSYPNKFEREYQSNHKKEQLMSMNKEEFSQYLHTLKEYQCKILKQEQEHLDMLNSIINKIN